MMMIGTIEWRQFKQSGLPVLPVYVYSVVHSKILNKELIPKFEKLY